MDFNKQLDQLEDRVEELKGVGDRPPPRRTTKSSRSGSISRRTPRRTARSPRAKQQAQARPADKAQSSWGADALRRADPASTALQGQGPAPRRPGQPPTSPASERGPGRSRRIRGHRLRADWAVEKRTGGDPRRDRRPRVQLPTRRRQRWSSQRRAVGAGFRASARAPASFCRVPLGKSNRDAHRRTPAVSLDDKPGGVTWRSWADPPASVEVRTTGVRLEIALIAEGKGDRAIDGKPVGVCSLGRRAETRSPWIGLLEGARSGDERGPFVVRGEARRRQGQPCSTTSSLNRGPDFRVAPVFRCGVRDGVGRSPGLQQLSAPFLGHLEHLPGPQGDALATAFGLRSGPSARSVFWSGFAVLGLLAEIAEAQPAHSA